MKNKQYWMCMIGPADPSEYKGNGADGPLRNAVRNAFYDMFDPDNDICSSGWGINQERYDILRSIHLYPTEDLKKVLIGLRLNNSLSNISSVNYGSDDIGLSSKEITKLL